MCYGIVVYLDGSATVLVKNCVTYLVAEFSQGMRDVLADEGKV